MIEEKDPSKLFKDIREANYVFLLVNPASGGGAAAQLLHMGFNYLEFQSRSINGLAKLFISDIRRGQPGNKDVFHILRAVVAAKLKLYTGDPRNKENFLSKQVRVVAAGGDGTMMWTFNELRNHSIDRRFLSCGIVPFGTGNDFANAFGAHVPTQKQPGESNIALMKRLTETWLGFEPTNFDLWKIRIRAAEDGGTFRKIDNATRTKKLLLGAEGKELKVLDGSMANYCSIGVESRIGLGFDRYRTDSALLNRGAYAMEGIKKFAFHRRRLVNSIIECLKVTPAWTNIVDKDSNGGWTEKEEMGNESTRTVVQCRSTGNNNAQKLMNRATAAILRSSRTFVDEVSADNEEMRVQARRSRVMSADNPAMMFLRHKVPTVPVTLSPCVSLVVLNIPSFAGGLDLWKSSQKKMGVRAPETENNSEWKEFVKMSMVGEQHIGDGILEVLSFQSLMELGLSNLMRVVPPSVAPGAWRVYQGGGTFHIIFRDDLQKDARIYFQIDGEFFQATRLERISIKRDCQVKVLVASKL